MRSQDNPNLSEGPNYTQGIKTITVTTSRFVPSHHAHAYSELSSPFPGSFVFVEATIRSRDSSLAVAER
jgi:hypothetical protein